MKKLALRSLCLILAAAVPQSSCGTQFVPGGVSVPVSVQAQAPAQDLAEAEVPKLTPVELKQLEAKVLQRIKEENQRVHGEQQVQAVVELNVCFGDPDFCAREKNTRIPHRDAVSDQGSGDSPSQLAVPLENP